MHNLKQGEMGSIWAEIKHHGAMCTIYLFKSHTIQNENWICNQIDTSDLVVFELFTLIKPL